MLWTQFLTTFPLEIIAPDEKQFGTGGGMSRTNAYDLVIIGGGIAGSSLACSMAKAGARVLLLESEIEFRDRVRGEILCPWGVAEIHSLGLSEALRNSGACEVRWLDQYMGPQQIEHRELPATTLTRTPIYTFYHPRMQTSLLLAAESAGVKVRRGTSVCAISQGTTPSVTYRADGSNDEAEARLVVVAEGRNSQFRRLPGFHVQREQQTFCIAGVLMENVPLPDDTFHLFTFCSRRSHRAGSGRSGPCPHLFLLLG